MRKELREYFYFNKLERNGFIGLILLVILLIVIRYLIIDFYPQVQYSEKDISAIEAAIDSIEQAQRLAIIKVKEQKDFKKLENLKEFNPNSLGIEDWMEFGLSDRQVAALLNYKEAIGGFKSKKQFRKVFVINDELHERLTPYLQLPDEYEEEKPAFEKWEKKEYEKKPRIYPKVNINTADTTEFKKLYGIGSFSARMIVKRRGELGGFVSKDQLKEVFGLKEETLMNLDTQLYIGSTAIRKIDVNEATKEELKAHPYLYWKHANAIVNYRKQHGQYQSLDDLKKIVIIDDSIFQKVKPYIKL